MEKFLQNPNLIRKDGSLNNQEPAIIFGNPKSQKVVAFENNILYDKNSFVSGYEIEEEAFEEFIKTVNIGLHPQERKFQKDQE